MRRATRSLLAGVGALALLSAPTPARADDGSPAWQCTNSGGTWIVVTVHGAPSSSGCYRGGGSSLDALQSVARVQQKPDGLICRINGAPAGGELCNPSNKQNSPFWFYYLKDTPNAGWLFAQEGPATHRPVRGGIEGWNFGTGERPFDPPPAPEVIPARAAAPAPAQPAPTNADGGNAAGQPAQPGRTTQAPAPASSSAPGSTASSSSDTPSPEESATPDPSESASASASATPSASAASSASAGVASESASAVPQPAQEQKNSPAGLLITLGVIALAALGGGGYWYATHRQNPKAS